MWKHTKDWVNIKGGTRDYQIQERLDEYIFHRTFLRDIPMNCWIMLRLLAKYGDRAKKFVEEDMKLDPMQKSKTRESRKQENWYRCEEIGPSEKEEKADKQLERIKQQLSTSRYELDENNNLLQINSYGDIEGVHYANSQQRNAGLYEQVMVAEEDEEQSRARIRENVERNRERMNIDEILPDW